MKDRIIRYLDDFTKGESDDLSLEIMLDFEGEGLAFTSTEFKLRSEHVLSLILHQYSQFSVSTIDAFFQRVIRSFTRETGLLGNFRLEVDNEMVLEEVIDLVMDKLTDNRELREWVLEFSLEKLIEGKDWDIRSALLGFSKEIFKEEFKKIEGDVLAATSDKDFFKNLKAKLQATVRNFEDRVLGDAKILLADFHANQLFVSDFKHGNSGSIYKYLQGLEKEIQLPGKKVLKALEDATEWPSPKNARANFIVTKAEQHWLPSLASLVTIIEKESLLYFSAKHTLDNLYLFGLLSDIAKTLREYLAENNMMLLSDAPQFLRELMKGQDASFLYEKVGSFLRHFLIDEFQDTSGFQWDNLLPLIKNGIAQSYKSMIVGDIKQSIYRWRGGDLEILQHKAKTDVGSLVVDTFQLDTNYRSVGHVVNFNNAIFQAASTIISKETGSAFPQQSYEDASQKIFRQLDKGYVNIQYLKTEGGEEEETSFKEVSLARLPTIVEDLQLKGVSLRDIAFLVRDNREGQLIAQHFMKYRATAVLKSGCKYDVVSNESLRLDQATSVLVLINAMRLLYDRNNQIASAQLAYEYQKLWSREVFPNHHNVFSKSKTKDFSKLVPLPFIEQQHVLAALPLVEVVETLIYIFDLGKLPTELAYLQGFQDVILEFAAREKSDLASFLEWWEVNKHKKSIQVAGGVDAAQIITIHKSKGLQFKYVIIPFLNWELNHSGTKSPILWCTSPEGIFKDAGFLPLKYTSKLENTYFKDDYVKERERIFLDNLNLLYVAFTRAEFGLIANAPLTKNNNITRVGNLVRAAIEQSSTLQSLWSAEKLCLVMGEIDPDKNERSTPQEELILKQYHVAPWRERLEVRTQGKEFFHETAKRKKINYGIFLHTLMARVKTKYDVQTVMDHAVKEGMIQPDERRDVEDSMMWIVSEPLLQEGFENNGKLKTEASIIMPDGSERRIDRVLIHDKRAFVIDYKTGDATMKDEEQVKNYLAILRAMGMKEMKGFLVYVNEKRCVEVK